MLSYRLLSCAGRIGKNRHTVLCHLAGRLLGIRHIGHYFMAYGYAKWVDDQIDRPLADEDKALSFLRRQAEVVEGTRRPEGFQEELGAGLGQFMRSGYGRAMRVPWQKLMSSFAFDVRRREEVLTREELTQHAIELGSGALGICEVAFDCPGAMGEPLTAAASAVYIGSDMLLDLRDDLGIGLINIPAEDLEAYGIPERALRASGACRGSENPDLGRWVRDRAADLQSAADAIEPALAELRPWAFRFFLREMSKRRRQKLQRAVRRWGGAGGA